MAWGNGEFAFSGGIWHTWWTLKALIVKVPFSILPFDCPQMASQMAKYNALVWNLDGSFPQQQKIGYSVVGWPMIQLLNSLWVWSINSTQPRQRVTTGMHPAYQATATVKNLLHVSLWPGSWDHNTVKGWDQTPDIWNGMGFEVKVKNRNLGESCEEKTSLAF